MIAVSVRRKSQVVSQTVSPVGDMGERERSAEQLNQQDIRDDDNRRAVQRIEIVSSFSSSGNLPVDVGAQQAIELAMVVGVNFFGGTRVKSVDCQILVSMCSFGKPERRYSIPGALKALGVGPKSMTPPGLRWPIA